MIERRAAKQVREALERQAAVAIIGPRQVGKTTLALDITDQQPSVYLDLEAPEDRAKLADPALFLRAYEDRLVVLDEIHRLPEVFQTLRGLIDQGRRRGHRTGRFLILGSASIELLRQSGESLAGRIEYIDLNPLDVAEIPVTLDAARQLWVRGGFPESYLARNDEDSFVFRRNFIRTYLERDVPQFGPRIAAESLERLWTMLAHGQGTPLNAARLAANLSVSSPTVSSYIDLLADLLLVRKLRPYSTNIGKRLVKSPKVYVRDSGLTHALLGIDSFETLAGHPIVGTSWEGFVIESLLAAAPPRTTASFYRTLAGAEIDLFLELPGNRGRWAIEIKRSLSPKVERGFHNARGDLAPERAFVVYPGEDRYPLGEGIETIGLRQIVDLLYCARLAALARVQGLLDHGPDARAGAARARHQRVQIWRASPSPTGGSPCAGMSNRQANPASSSSARAASPCPSRARGCRTAMAASSSSARFLTSSGSRPATRSARNCTLCLPIGSDDAISGG